MIHVHANRIQNLLFHTPHGAYNPASPINLILSIEYLVCPLHSHHVTHGGSGPLVSLVTALCYISLHTVSTHKLTLVFKKNLLTHILGHDTSPLSLHTTLTIVVVSHCIVIPSHACSWPCQCPCKLVNFPCILD